MYVTYLKHVTYLTVNRHTCILEYIAKKIVSYTIAITTCSNIAQCSYNDDGQGIVS